MMMSNPLIPALLALGGMVAAGGAASHRLRSTMPERGWRWWHLAAAVAGLLNLGLIAWRAGEVTPPRWLHHSFDVTVFLATLILAVGLFCAARPRLRGLEGLFLPLAAIIQAAAFLALARGPERPPTDAPAWFVLHTLTLTVGATCFLVGGTAAAAYLAINRALRHKRPTGFLGHVPPLESLERLSRWMLTIGLPLFTFGILTGICELVQADEPWLWLKDPVVILSFASWLMYATTLVAIWLRPRNRGRRAAVLSASGFAVLVIVFLVFSLFPTAHQ